MLCNFEEKIKEKDRGKREGRHLNLLSELFDESAGNALVTPQFEKVKSCWEKLEDAHDKFVSMVNETGMDLDTDLEGYLYISWWNRKV